MENPFEVVINRLAAIEAQQATLIELIRSLPKATVVAPENPLTVEEAAKLFGIAKQTLYQNKKRIRHTKQFGRIYFYPADLRAYINEGKNL